MIRWNQEGFVRQTQSVYVRIETQSWKLRWDHVYPVFLIWVCCSVQLTYNRSCITAANTVGVIFSTVNLKTLEDRMIPIALFLQFKALTINMKHTRGSPHPHLLVPTHTRFLCVVHVWLCRRWQKETFVFFWQKSRVCSEKTSQTILFTHTFKQRGSFSTGCLSHDEAEFNTDHSLSHCLLKRGGVFSVFSAELLSPVPQVCSCAGFPVSVKSFSPSKNE